MIADDSHLINAMIVESVKKGGFNTVSFEDGKQSLDYFREHQDSVDAIVSDIEMPNMDGFESCKLIKQIKPDFPVIIFSSLVNDALKNKVADLGFDAMITKPELGKVIELLDKVLNIELDG